MAQRAARQRSYTTVVPAPPKRSAIHPAPENNGVCRCNDSDLAPFCKPPSSADLDFHTMFAQCTTPGCNTQPGAYVCCLCFKAFCKHHARDHFSADQRHFVMMNYEIWQYERCFWCFKCNAFCMSEAFDNVLEPMFSSKGSFCPKPMRAKATDRFEHRGLVIGTSTAQGWRSDNEDCHVVFLELPQSKLDFFAVFDGHGGPLASRFIGQHMHTAFDTSVKALADTPDATERALERTFLATDEALLAEAGEDCGTCGSTACVVVYNAETKRLTCANAGDTRAVLSRGGKALDLSRDHRPVDDDERKRVVAAGSGVVDERVDGMLAVSRAFGDFEFKQARSLPPQAQAVTCAPETRSVQLGPEDQFAVVACDGIWDCMTSQAVVDFVLSQLDKADPAKIAEALIDRCMAPTIPDDGIGTDNMSVVIIRFA